MPAGFISESWPASNRNDGRLQVGIPGRNKSESAGRLDTGRPIEQERLIYQPYEPSTARSHRRPERAENHFDHLRERLEEIVARDESEPVILFALRHDRGVPPEMLAQIGLDGLYVRADQGGWGPLKRSNFDDLLAYFTDAADGHTGSATFIDWIPLSQTSGEIGRLIDGFYDDRLQEFEARLKERSFRLFLIVAIDSPATLSTVVETNPRIRCLPWTDLWLADFARTYKLSANTLLARVAERLRSAATWRGYEDDDYESNLSQTLQTIRTDSVGVAITEIEKALETARLRGPNSTAGEQSRKDLSKYLGSPGSSNPADPVKQVMLAVAIFAGGTRVREYYRVCQQLLPEGPAEILRLPLVVREALLGMMEQAEQSRRETPPRPGWNVVFEMERDNALAELGIRLGQGQAIELDSKWRSIDLRHVIARTYPGLIATLMERVHEKRLFLLLSEAESSLLAKIICEIRDACQEGFDDRELALALIGAQRGLSDLGTPHEIIETLYPGQNADQVIKLVENIGQGDFIADSLAAMGTPDPELEQHLVTLKEIYPEVTPQNFAAKFEDLRQRLREESVRRLTRHLIRMRKSSNESEQNRPIVTSMLDIFEQLLSSETYVALLTYMIATTAEVDPADIGKRLSGELSHANVPEMVDIVLAVNQRLKQALNYPGAPHKSWLLAFDPVRQGKAQDDRIRSLAVFVWDMIINYDVLRSTVPYQRMKHLRVVQHVFGSTGNLCAGPDFDTAAETEKVDPTLGARLISGFLARDPADWLRSMAMIERIFQDVGRFDLADYIQNRIEDTVWVIATGAAEADWTDLQGEMHSLSGDLLVSLTASLDLGFERRFNFTAQKVAEAAAGDRSNSRWLALYGLFWPATIAHWRFTAFGIEPFVRGSEPDRQFRLFLEQLVEIAPKRSHAYRDGFNALAEAADQCADKADTMIATASALIYRKKADRLRGLANFFRAHALDVPVVV
ncbi:hypothetical protein [Bradyrhizobium liaoningense]